MPDEGARARDPGPETRAILVTGTHRSGTTWVGDLLRLSGEVVGIHEPFNPRYERSWLREPPANWFHHIPTGSVDRALRDDVAAMLALRPPTRELVRRARGWRGRLAVGKDVLEACLGRVRGRRALLKDPIALFAAEWLAEEFGTLNVVLVRHPAAFAGSLKRLGWRFDFGNLERQSELLRGPLNRFRRDISAAATSGGDVVDDAVLLWRICNSVVLEYRQRHPNWTVVRYEDVASSPVPACAHLYRSLGLTWSRSVEHGIERLTGPSNVDDVPAHDKGSTRRHSAAALSTWRRRLTTEEVDRVMRGTADVAVHWGYDVDLPEGSTWPAQLT